MNDRFYFRTGGATQFVPLWNSDGGQNVVLLADLVTLDRPEVITFLAADLRVTPPAPISVYVVLTDIGDTTFYFERRANVPGDQFPTLIPIGEAVPAGQYILRVAVDAAPLDPDTGQFSEVALGLSAVASDGLLYYTAPPGGPLIAWATEPGDIALDLYRFHAVDVPGPGFAGLLLAVAANLLLRRPR